MWKARHKFQAWGDLFSNFLLCLTNSPELNHFHFMMTWQQTWEAGTKGSLANCFYCTENVTYKMKHKGKIKAAIILCPSPLPGRSGDALRFAERLEWATQRLHTSGKHTYVHSSHTYTQTVYNHLVSWCFVKLKTFHWKQPSHSDRTPQKCNREAVFECYATL